MQLVCASGVFSVVPPRSHHVSSNRAVGRPERLLRSCITAFCSNPRPTRREISQLDDLAVPLLGAVPDECLRFVAATLSDLPHAPPLLIQRLADQPVDISAPILMRSPVLSDIDLVALIGRHGAGHARAIAARPNLDERIDRLIRSIGALEETAPEKAEETRHRLRLMMRPAGPVDAQPAAEVRLRWDGAPDAYRKLRSTALAGIPALFHTALADVLEVEPRDAREIAEDDGIVPLLMALRSLSLTSEQAILILQCVRNVSFKRAREIAELLEAYESIDLADATEVVRKWRGTPMQDEAANSSAPTSKLRAS